MTRKRKERACIEKFPATGCDIVFLRKGEVVARLVASLKDEHYAWTAVFNRRIAIQRS